MYRMDKRMTTKTPNRTDTWLDGIKLDSDDDDFVHLCYEDQRPYKAMCGNGKRGTVDHMSHIPNLDWFEGDVPHACPCGTPICPDCRRIANS